MSFNISDPYELYFSHLFSLHYCNEQEQSIQDQNKLFIENLVIYDVKYQIHHNATILQVFNEQNQLNKTLWGLQDIQFPSTNNYDQVIKQHVEENVLSTVYSQTLEGGQLFKIGYSSEVDAWLIYCNHLTIAAKISDDLTEYAQQRFDAPVQVAELWFNILNECINHSNLVNETQIKNLKSDFNNRTVYGQIINEESLIYQPENQLYFIGIKDVDFEQSQQLFGFYGLPHPKVAQLSLSLKVLQKHVERIQRSDIELEKAGVILYFGNNQIVVNTAEFLLYKQIQSILLNEQHIERDLKVYSKSLSKLPRPFKFYQNILEEGIKVTNQFNKVDQFIKNRFNDFLTIILYNIFNNRNFNWNQTRNVVDYRVEWSSYQHDQLTRLPVYTGEHSDKPPENVFLIIPIGINGVGVSTFARTFQTYYPHTQIITNLEDAKIKDNQVIILDHNHTSEEAQQILAKCSQFYNKIILQPLTSGMNQLRLPFSFELIITALKRNCHSVEKISAYLKKLKTFQSFNFSKIQGDGVIEFPFVDESQKIDHQYLQEDFVELYQLENKKNLNNFWKSFKEVQLHSNTDTYDEEIKSIIHGLFPKISKIDKHQPVKVDDVVRKQSEDVALEKPSKHQKVQKKDKLHTYDPTYLPNSLSFQIVGGYNVKERLNKWVRDTLAVGSTNFKNDEEFLKIQTIFRRQTQENAEQHFIPEKDLALQLLSIAPNDQSVRQLPYFQQFVQDKEAEIYLKTLFISLDGLIAVLANQSSLPCQSPYPHVCLYSKALKAKDSLDVISQTILQNQNLKAAFKQGQLFKAGDANIFAKEEIRYRNKNYKVYVISVKDGITVNGISTDKL